jgi:hypothetical protein
MAYAPDAVALCIDACGSFPPDGTCVYATMVSASLGFPRNNIANALAAGFQLIFVTSGTYAGFSVIAPDRIIAGQYDNFLGTSQVEITTAVTAATTLQLLNMNFQTGINAGGGAHVRARDCYLTGTAAGSSCASCSSTVSTSTSELILHRCTIETTATNGARANGAYGFLELNEVTIKRLLGGGTNAVLAENGGHISGTDGVTVEGTWTNAVRVEATGGSIDLTWITANLGGVSNGVSNNGGDIIVRGLDFAGPGIASGAGISNSSNSSNTTIYPNARTGADSQIRDCQRGVDSQASTDLAKLYRTTIHTCRQGVRIDAGRVELYGCLIHSCTGQAATDGGGCYVLNGGDLVIDFWAESSDLPFVDNQVHVTEIYNCQPPINQDGGAIAATGSGSTVTVSGCRIHDCVATGTGRGGAIRVENGATLTIGSYENHPTGSTFDGGEDGRDIWLGWDPYDSGRVDQGAVEITACSAQDGGGISVDVSTLVLTNSRVHANNARNVSAATDGAGGGGIHANNSTVTIRSSLIDTNSTGGSVGAGVHYSNTVAGRNLVILKCDFLDNDPGGGAGGHLYLGGDSDSNGSATNSIFKGAVGSVAVHLKTGTSFNESKNCWFDNDGGSLNSGSIGANSFEADPVFCGLYPKDFALFRTVRINRLSPCAAAGDRSLAFGSEDPFVDPVVGCSGVACGTWQQELPTPSAVSGETLDPGIGTCDYETFAGAYDEDWTAILEQTTGVDHRTIVCLDPGGLGIQLTCILEGMRPLTQSRDVRFQEYQGQDVDLVLNDPEGVMDPAVSGSLLDGVAWEGLKVFVGSWLVGTQRVLAHAIYYLEDVQVEEGKVVFRCKDAFARLQDTQVRANVAIQIVESGGGTLSAATVGVSYAPIETWTITFASAAAFRVRGSISGADGEGSTASDFTSDSGAITISSSAWGGTWAEGDTATFRTVAQYSGNLFTVCRTILVTNTDLSEADLNTTSWDAAVASFSLHEGAFTQRTTTTALSLLRLLMRHGPATAYPDHEGKIAIAYFLPRLGVGVETEVCRTYDLERLQTERNDRYTSITVRYAPDTNGDLQLASRWPREEPGNLPFEMDLPGFGAEDESIVDFVAQRIFALFEEGREIYGVDLLLQDLNFQLEDIVYIDSRYPNRTTYGQVIGFEKALTDLQIRAKLLDVSWLVQSPGGCGYAFCDVGHRCDDCWICW